MAEMGRLNTSHVSLSHVEINFQMTMIAKMWWSQGIKQRDDETSENEW